MPNNNSTCRYLGENDEFEHSPSDKRENQGENIAAWCDSKGETGAEVTKRWWEEMRKEGAGTDVWEVYDAIIERWKVL